MQLQIHFQVLLHRSHMLTLLSGTLKWFKRFSVGVRFSHRRKFFSYSSWLSVTTVTPSYFCTWAGPWLISTASERAFKQLLLSSLYSLWQHIIEIIRRHFRLNCTDICKAETQSSWPKKHRPIKEHLILRLLQLLKKKNMLAVVKLRYNLLLNKWWKIHLFHLICNHHVLSGEEPKNCQDETWLIKVTKKKKLWEQNLCNAGKLNLTFGRWFNLFNLGSFSFQSACHKKYHVWNQEL